MNTTSTSTLPDWLSKKGFRMFIQLPNGMWVNPEKVASVRQCHSPDRVEVAFESEMKHYLLKTTVEEVLAALAGDDDRTAIPPSALVEQGHSSSEIVCCLTSEGQAFRDSGWPKEQIVYATFEQLIGRQSVTKAWVTNRWLEVMGLGRAWAMLVQYAIRDGGSIQIVTGRIPYFSSRV